MPREIPIRQTTVRPLLTLGGDRDLVMGTGLLTAVLSVGTMDPYSAAAGAGLWIVVLAVLQQMAKADPQMRQVWWRNHRTYRQAYYPARSTPACKGTKQKVHKSK